MTRSEITKKLSGLLEERLENLQEAFNHVLKAAHGLTMSHNGQDAFEVRNKKGDLLAHGDFDRGADGWFASSNYKKGQMFFSEAIDLLDFVNKNKSKFTPMKNYLPEEKDDDEKDGKDKKDKKSDKPYVEDADSEKTDDKKKMRQDKGAYKELSSTGVKDSAMAEEVIEEAQINPKIKKEIEGMRKKKTDDVNILIAIDKKYGDDLSKSELEKIAVYLAGE